MCLEDFFLLCGFQQEIKVELVYGLVYWKHYIKAKVLVVISFFWLVLVYSCIFQNDLFMNKDYLFLFTQPFDIYYTRGIATDSKHTVDLVLTCLSFF